MALAGLRQETPASEAAQWAKDNLLVAPNMVGVAELLHIAVLVVS